MSISLQCGDLRPHDQDLRPISVRKVNVYLEAGKREGECQREDIALIKRAASHTDVGIARHRLHVR